MARIHDQVALTPEQLRRRVDPSSLPFNSTAEVAPLESTIGQPRALDAIEFGLDVRNSGYNIYIAGAPGSGRETTVYDHLQRYAPTRPTPSDWVYVYNFQHPDQPLALRLPACQGQQFARDMEEFLQGAQREIPRAFESEDYARRRRDALGDLTAERNRIFTELQEFARARSFAVEATPAGIVTVPVVQGKPLTPEEFQRLPPATQQQLQQIDQEIRQQVNSALRQAQKLEKEAMERVNRLDREVALFAVGQLFAELRERYADLPEVLAHLDRLQEDLAENLDDFRPQPPAPVVPGMPAPPRGPDLSRYTVNLLIDNAECEGAPVVVERNPTYYNLIGRIDYRATFGQMVTDFRQIKPGALHMANGGYLVLHAAEVLTSPFAWDALKRALLTKQIQVENLGEQLTPLPTGRLRPAPIDLDIKVILVGPLELYHVLYQLDEDFQELFKVKADFAPDMEWNAEHLHNYAAFISRRVQESGLLHFDPSGVGRVVEYGARLRESQTKLSTRLLDIANIVTEASYWAEKAGRELVTAADVDQAIRKREYRSNLVEERLQEYIANGTIMIDTDGAAVGRVNGLAVLSLGDYAFGKPSRITARVSPGLEGVQSIEREIALSGPIHSKGVLILAGYLQGQYAQNWPLALAATITFEQAYEGIEGDSASSTELYALLSALSGLPLDQGIAVTGSVNQYGQVQAVGGVTQKIEGYYEVCKATGLTGRQGVIIPAANIQNLMLDDEVVQAVRDGRFHVWAVRTIDEGIELLTGHPAGERGPDGEFPEGTVHRLVADRLQAFAEEMRRFRLEG